MRSKPFIRSDGRIVCPFKLTIALAENANVNGVEFLLDTEVKAVRKLEKGGYEIETDRESYETACVINAAGVYADVFNNMVSERKISITPRKGEYCLLDKKAGNFVSHTVFQLPTKMGKGVLITPTVHGNLLVGPTADDIEDKEGIQTTARGLGKVASLARVSGGSSAYGHHLSFAGLRATEKNEDFVLGEVEDWSFFQCGGH